MPPASDIEALVAAGHTVRGLETTLGLSGGYLSKVRHGTVRASAQLVALLAVLRAHPEALATVARATRGTATGGRESTDTARVALLRVAGTLSEKAVRWALSGRAALATYGVPIEVGAGIDVVVDYRDRHVLQILRDAGHGLAHHPPSLAVAHFGGGDANETLRVHFPSLPPLAPAIRTAARREVDGVEIPVIGLLPLTLSFLLSQREGSLEAARAAIAAGTRRRDLLRALSVLDAAPPVESAHLLRVFDRKLARRRLAAP